MPNFEDSDVSRTVVDTLPTGVCVIDRAGKILIWNQGAERIAGHRQHEVIGRHHNYVLATCKGQDCNDPKAACPITLMLHEGKSTESGILLQHKQGHSVPVLMRFVGIRDAHGSIVAVAANFDSHNSWSRREQDRVAAPSGCAEEVTGLANRGFTDFTLRENLAAFAEYHIPFGVICIRVEQLDHFRAAYGHEAGDSILRVVAKNLNHSFRPNDFIGRWGGDEFIAVLMNCGHAGVLKAFERIQPLVNRAAIRWWGEQLSLNTTLGYASVQVGDTVASLLQRAERPQGHTSGDAAATPPSSNARGAGS